MAIFIATQWLVRFLLVRYSLNHRNVLTPLSKGLSGKHVPKVSLIIAAKDEEENIEICVRTLLDQDYPNFELIVVDDRSEDRTLEILQQIEKEAGGQLKVLHVSELPEGWFGKNNAMRHGTAISTGEWICLLDADCKQTSQKTISIAMQEALEKKLDFLTITPVLEMETAWEKLIQPTCAMALITWFRPERVNNPKTKTGYANGAFMLMKRSCYDVIGRHDRVKQELNEDILMAEYTKEAGLSLRMVENEGLYQTYMYSSLRQAWHGWSRIYAGSLRSSLKLSVTALAIILFTLLPWVLLTFSIGMRFVAPEVEISQWNFAIGMWAAVVLLSYLPSWKFYSVLPINKRWSLAYPIAAAFTVSFISFALIKHWGFANTLWHGTICQFQGNEMMQAELEETDIAA